MYIHEHKEWPSFSWNKELVGEKLNKVNKAVGYLMGRLSIIGFNDKMTAVVESIYHDIIASSEIEGVELSQRPFVQKLLKSLFVAVTHRNIGFAKDDTATVDDADFVFLHNIRAVYPHESGSRQHFFHRFHAH